MQRLRQILRSGVLGLSVLTLSPLAVGAPGAAQPPALPLPPPIPAPAPAPAAAHPAAPVEQLVADERWCGIESARPAAEPAVPCKYPGLPCGPASAEQISRGAGEVGEDLDGDGRPDLTLAGRRDVPKPEIYAAIYRSVDDGYVLVDYHPVPLRSEPTIASVLLAAPGSAPLLRDGYDSLEAGGKTLSIARLRRWDGQRFRTLLTFCAHRAEAAGGTLREGHNRVEILDVDKDGQKDVVIHGLIQPVVFKFADGGLSLSEDATLSQLYRDSSPEIRRARELRLEAARLVESGQVRRAAETLQRAHASMPYDVSLTAELCALLIRTGQADQAVDLLSRARYQAPERAGIYCALAKAHRAQGMSAVTAERSALRACLAKNPDDAQRAEAEARLRELSGPVAPAAATSPAEASPPPDLDLP